MFRWTPTYFLYYQSHSCFKFAEISLPCNNFKRANTGKLYVFFTKSKLSRKKRLAISASITFISIMDSALRSPKNSRLEKPAKTGSEISIRDVFWFLKLL